MSSYGYFYKDKPIFGLDIGFNTIKVMQLEEHSRQYRVIGYGIGGFKSEAIKDGVIVDYEHLAQAILNLFKNNIVGEITTKRVAVSIPATRTFPHAISLPVLSGKALDEAVMLESEQTIPLPMSDLYIDYETIGKTADSIEIQTVAVPRKIVDSYLDLMKIIGLEPVVFDSSIKAAGRLFNRQEENSDIPAVLIDFGSVSADIAIQDKTSIITGTIPAGSDIFTDLLAKGLKISREEALVIKTKYGIGKSKKQAEIIDLLKPELEQIVREVRRVIRYYEERSTTGNKVGQIITMGGGANLPGLSGYLTDLLRLPVRTSEPWQDFKLKKLKAPSQNEKTVFVTVSGLCMIKPGEIFA
ncbi:type IV pilus assembly protein PilM [Candidatus Parcubacteria bacterium]|nr:type IV pilus assembly protein PilM [Candidatus Parcubacteria bacterium]